MNEVQVWWVGVECRQKQEAVDDILGTVDLVTVDGTHNKSDTDRIENSHG